MTLIRMIVAVTACASVMACGSTPSTRTSEPSSAPASSVQRYDLKGTVVSLDKSHSSVTVNHDEIKGFMSAMTMAYAVKDAKALDALAKGDVVTAKLVSTGESYIDAGPVEGGGVDRRARAGARQTAGRVRPATPRRSGYNTIAARRCHRVRCGAAP
jgi:Cu/Ag efflux protein CusF